MPNESVTFTREQMYELMWSTPMKQITAQFDETNFTLAKLCDKHLIPRPPTGFWPSRKLPGGRKRPELPCCQDPTLQSICLRGRPPQPPAPEFDEDVQELVRKAKGLLPIKLASSLKNLHPLVELTRRRLEQAKPDMYGLVSPIPDRQRDALPVYVARASIPRALLFFDALIKGVEVLGGCVKIDRDKWKCETVVHLAGERVARLRLRERYTVAGPHKRKKDEDVWEFSSRKHDYAPTGRLVLDSGPSCSSDFYCEDTSAGRRIEEFLDNLIVSFAEGVGWFRIHRREAEARRKQQEADERVRREREAELQRRRYELAKKRQDEQTRVDHLLAEARAWQQGIAVRRYIRAVERLGVRLHGQIEPGSKLDQWLLWARQQADRIDPLSPSPPSVLDETL